jgi:hypothetical protein
MRGSSKVSAGLQRQRWTFRRGGKHGARLIQARAACLKRLVLRVESMGHYVSAAQLLASVTEGMADRHVTRIHRGRRSFMLALNDEKQMEQGGITRDALQALNNVARETASLFTAETDLQQVEEIHTTLEKLATSRAQEVDTQRDLLRSARLSWQYHASYALVQHWRGSTKLKKQPRLDLRPLRLTNNTRRSCQSWTRSSSAWERPSRAWSRVYRGRKASWRRQRRTPGGWSIWTKSRLLGKIRRCTSY